MAPGWAPALAGTVRGSSAAAGRGIARRKQTAGKRNASLLGGVGQFPPRGMLEHSAVAECVCLMFPSHRGRAVWKWNSICPQNGKCGCKCKSVCVYFSAEAGFLRAKCSQVTTPTRLRAIADGGDFDRNVAARAVFPAERCKKTQKTKPPRTSLDKQEMGRTVLKEGLGENSSLILAGQRLERGQRW